MRNEANLGFRIPGDGRRRAGTCQVYDWDHAFLDLFWKYNANSLVILHFRWKMLSDESDNISESRCCYSNYRRKFHTKCNYNDWMAS